MLNVVDTKVYCFIYESRIPYPVSRILHPRISHLGSLKSGIFIAAFLNPLSTVFNSKLTKMEKMNFSTSINAPKEKVWKTLWEDSSYRKWTSVFAEDSSVKTDNWKEGSKVLFLDGKGNGMVSTVAANRPNEFMSFKHLGVVKDGQEDTSSEKVNEWAGATENYTLKGNNGNTELLVEMDITDEFKDYFLKTWPQALDKIKQLSEN